LTTWLITSPTSPGDDEADGAAAPRAPRPAVAGRIPDGLQIPAAAGDARVLAHPVVGFLVVVERADDVAGQAEEADDDHAESHGLLLVEVAVDGFRVGEVRVGADAYLELADAASEGWGGKLERLGCGA